MSDDSAFLTHSHIVFTHREHSLQLAVGSQQSAVVWQVDGKSPKLPKSSRLGKFNLLVTKTYQILIPIAIGMQVSKIIYSQVSCLNSRWLKIKLCVLYELYNYVVKIMPSSSKKLCVFTSLRAFVLVLVCTTTLSAQEAKEKNWNLQGYTKSMQGLFHFNIPGLGNQTISDNFLHNRLNFNWYPSDNWTFKAGLRTRFFFGEFSRIQPDFKSNLGGVNDVLNLTLLNVGEKTILHSYLDRAYFQYNKDKLEIRFGRQRINWGINTVWNPNDLFNAFTFTDFDYEERPGSDALRIQYYIGYAGSIEFAIKAFDNSDEIVAASLYKFNKWNYDFQVLAGWSRKDIVLGGGWAGSIKDWGFKGEFSWFNSTIAEVDNNFAATISADYSFENSLYIAGGLLYNEVGTTTNSGNIFNFELSARNLYPYKWSVFTSAGFPITPLFTTNLALIYSPIDGHPLFLTPTFTYSLGQNLDVDFVSQIVLQDGMERYGSDIQVFYLRVKWSY